MTTQVVFVRNCIIHSRLNRKTRKLSGVNLEVLRAHVQNHNGCI